MMSSHQVINLELDHHHYYDGGGDDDDIDDDDNQLRPDNQPGIRS